MNTDDGYIRIRADLTNGDFLEAAEYFILQEGQVFVSDYRHQWMDNTKTILRRRWDNSPDHPGLAAFPDHIHDDRENNVIAGKPVSLVTVPTLIESEISPTI